MTKKTVKTSKKKTYSDYRFRLGTLIIVLGTVLSFALGVGATIGLRSSFNHKTTDFQSVEITGSDGLMGSVGYGNPFSKSENVLYRVTYNNTSSEDRFIQIKATQRSSDGTGHDANSPVIDLGAYTGTIYSEKKLVKTGTKEVFELPLFEYASIPTKYVELEAVKSKTD